MLLERFIQITRSHLLEERTQVFMRIANNSFEDFVVVYWNKIVDLTLNNKTNVFGFSQLSSVKNQPENTCRSD